MREIDLSKYNIRTDLINDLTDELQEELIEKQNIKISRVKVDKKLSLKIDRKVGNYTTIYFKDITDHTNFNNVLNSFKEELERIVSLEKIKENDSVLIVGLGNEKSTPDSLGVNTALNVIPTKHIYDLTGKLEEGFRVSSIFVPGVMGVTGIESSSLLDSVISIVKPNFIIIIDALASDSIDRLCKTIQITNTGINPGSGIGNNRKEISKDTCKIPVIAIGVPMVVDAVTIVSDTINYMMKHFSYNLKKEINTDKLIPSHMRNYLKYKDLYLSEEETNYFLGAFGNLSQLEKKSLIFDVLSPVEENLIVTPNEVDFLIEKLVDLLSKGINLTIHK